MDEVRGRRGRVGLAGGEGETGKAERGVEARGGRDYMLREGKSLLYRVYRMNS